MMTETGTNNLPAWFCARTQPKHEGIAAACLAKQLGLETFLPRLKMERASRRGILHVVEPLFPCYLFVRCQKTELDAVRYVTGISCILQFALHTPPVPDSVIEELRECFESEEPMSIKERFEPGAAVTVAEGAFAGFNGIVLRCSSANQRVQILLEFLGRTMLAEVDRRSLTVEDRCVADLMPLLAVAPTTQAAGF